MNLGEYSIEKRTVVLVLTVVAAVAGMIAYENLGRLEDPEFTIKRALVFTSDPGASAEEVDREVTAVLDKAIQRMGQIKRLESRSLRGRSIIEVVVKDKYDKALLPAGLGRAAPQGEGGAEGSPTRCRPEQRRR